MSEQDAIATRKLDHIRVCLDPESQSHAPDGWDRYRLEPDALPELALSEVDLSTSFLGKRLSAPLLVSSMTGGPVEGARINRHLAEAVEALGLGLGVGSQRIAIERPEFAATFEVRSAAPTALVLGNLGAVQLNYGYGEAQARRAVEMIGADGLWLHLNAVQEAIQEGGDTNFAGLEQKIAALVRAVPFPVAVKECGAGISGRTAARLWATGVRAIDVSGVGGTSWARVEGLRATSPLHRTLGETFRAWGLTTPRAVRDARRAVPGAVIVASGGIRSGLDAAKAIALGADLVSIAQPVLAASMESGRAVIEVLERFLAELRVASFAVGARNIAELRAASLADAP